MDNNNSNDQPLVSPSGEDEITTYVHVDDVKEAAKRLSFSKTLDVDTTQTSIMFLR